MNDRAVKAPAKPFATLIRRIQELEGAEHALARARRALRIASAHLDEAVRRGEPAEVRAALRDRITAARRALDAEIAVTQIAESRFDSARAACS